MDEDRWMDRRTDEWIEGQMEGGEEGQMDEDRGREGRTDGRMDRHMKGG